VAWAKVKSVLGRDLGGPSLLPTKVLGIRRGFTFVLAASLLVLVIDQAWLHRPPAPYVPPPSPTPTQAPHFALDDVDLGPGIRLTRFYPNDNVWDGYAVEAGDGKLYVNYSGSVSPAQWGLEVPERTAVATLAQGHLSPIQFSASPQRSAQYSLSAELEGLWHGLPIIHVTDGANARDWFVTISGSKIVTLTHRPPISYQSSPWCIAFDGGRICSVMSGANWEVSISLPGRDSLLVKGARYANDPPYAGTWDTGNVKLIGGGRHHFLLVEYHIGQDAAECLEGDAP